MDAMATDLDSRERRIHQRHNCYWPATCLLSEGQKASVVIIDASAGGFCVLSNLPINNLEIINLNLESIGTFDCQVRWKTADRFGVQIIEGVHELKSTDVDNLAQTLHLVSATLPEL